MPLLVAFLVVLTVGNRRPELVKSFRIEGIIGTVIQIVARKTQIGLCFGFGNDHFLSKRFVFVTIVF